MYATPFVCASHHTLFHPRFSHLYQANSVPVNCSLQEEKLLTEAKEAIETELQSTYVVCSPWTAASVYCVL